MKKFLPVVLAFLHCIAVHAQKNSLPSFNNETIFQHCGSDIMLREQRKDPRFKAMENEMNARIRSASRTLDDTIYTLPVVFHIIMQNPGSITDQDVLFALQNLNDIFGKTGSYGSSAGADTKIRFCLAQNDPDGGNSNGITRTVSYAGANHELIIEDDKLKNLVQWDPSRYINIWLVSNIATENMAVFNCGIWTRSKQIGYAFLPMPYYTLDGIVISGINGGTSLAHEMGHYLGLYHTFEGFGCSNNNCETDGDKVCDTPPDASTSSSNACNNPTNSCSTDTLSNHSNGSFVTDVPDQITNIMDYGNDACHNEFTEGQAMRMRAAIITQRSQLLQYNCVKPCAENTNASFTRNNWDPVPGNLIQFTNTSTGGSNFLWFIDGIAVSNQQNFSHTFGANGKYKVMLKVFNADSSCYAAYSDYIIVSCGTHARFYTDKRTIASKFPIYTDSIRFTNNSENATGYQWMMTFNTGAEQVVSNNKDYKHVFLNPGNYKVRLVASKGSCADTTEFFPVPVANPTADGTLYFNSAHCYQQSKIRLTVQICNYGYAPIPAKTPITFYDKDPQQAGARKVGTTFLFPDSIKGNCCSASRQFMIDSVPGLNQLYGVLNDNGTTLPLRLPNTSLEEKSYTNNISYINNLQVHIGVIPATATLEPGDTLRLNTQVVNGFGGPSYLWSTPSDLDCSTCANPIFTAGNKIDTITKKLIVTNPHGCSDTTYAVLKIPPYDDFRLTADSIKCAGADSLFGWFTLCNRFKRGIIPKDLQVALYDADPATAGAHLLGPSYKVTRLVNGNCFSFSHHFRRTDALTMYAVVNGFGLSVPVSFPLNNSFREKDYSNNISPVIYEPEIVMLEPSDTIVFKKQLVPMKIRTPIYDPASVLWQAGSRYSLSCINCAAPVVTLNDSSVMQMQMANQYGCTIRGTAKLFVFPPDLTVQILETSCYTNATTLVKFKICMNNAYDSLLRGIPLSFYDGDPNTGLPVLLGTFVYKGGKPPANCDTLLHIIKSPASLRLFAVINDKGNNPRVMPGQFINETDYNNNTGDTATIPFRAKVSPADTTILRFNQVQVTGSVKGGILNGFSWTPTDFFSCATCITPIVTPAHSKRYMFIAGNERFCVDTAYANIKTFAGGVISVPNAFTPDNDGRNDILYVMGSRDVSLVKEFAIFNRWGQKLFAASNTPANDPQFGWNGFTGGQPAAGGTYVYAATILFGDGSTQVFKGTVIIVR